MSKRLLKQIIIAGIFLAIFGGLVFWIVYAVQPEPTCFDGKLNQDEIDVDCGGVCQPCELVYAQEVQTLWAKAIPTENDYYDLVALIKNPNPNYGSGEISYNFELYDNTNQLIAAYPAQTYLLPNQEKYLTKLRVLSPTKVAKTRLAIGEPEWERPLKEKPAGLYVKEKQYQLLPAEEAGFSQARAILVNDTDYNFDTVLIDVFLFSDLGELAAVNNYQVNNFFSGQKRDFRVIWLYSVRGKINRVEMQVETNLFNSENFIELRPEEEKFQEY